MSREGAARIPSDDVVNKMNFLSEHIAPPTALTLEQNCFMYHKRIARTLLMDKHVVYIGDSLTRAMYKDILNLIIDGSLADPNAMKSPNETSYKGDHQIDILPLEMNRVFRQAREFQSNRHLIQYFFTSRAMREDLEKTALLFEERKEKPDIVLMNSALWDVSRYSSLSELENRTLQNEIEVIDEYLNRLAMFLRRMRAILAPNAMFIWLLMPVVSESSKTHGFIHWNRMTYDEIRMRLMEANMRAASLVREAGFDVLDMSFHFRSSMFELLRIRDGVHWNNIGVRFMNQLFLGHIVSALGISEDVQKKLKPGIRQLLEPSNRHMFFTVALKFLEDMDTDGSANEQVQQMVRMEALERFERMEGSHSIIEFLEKLRTVLTFKRIQDNQNKLNSKINRNRPEDGIYSSKEDYDEITEIIEDLRKKWKVENGGQRVIVRQNPRKRAMVRESPSTSTDSVPVYCRENGEAEEDVARGGNNRNVDRRDEEMVDDDIIFVNTVEDDRSKNAQPTIVRIPMNFDPNFTKPRVPQ